MRAAERARRLAAALLILAFALVVGLLPAVAARPNGAGIVVQFEDGSRIYAYVQFEEDSLTSMELLLRSGLDVVVAPFGGMGGAVCSIESQGCPSSNCFCQSYGNPAYFWHFYAWQDGAWSEQMQGASSRRVTDGSIDGWLWSAGDTSLPPVSIDEIALMNGVDRNAPAPEDTPTPTPEPEPTPTATPAPPMPTATEPPAPSETPTPPPTETPEPPTPTATEPLATATTSATHTATATRTPTAIPSPTPSATASPSAVPTATLGATTVAVFVAPDGTPVPLATIRDGDGDTPMGYLIFGGMAAVAIAAGTYAVVRNRQGRSDARPPVA